MFYYTLKYLDMCSFRLTTICSVQCTFHSSSGMILSLWYWFTHYHVICCLRSNSL